MGNTISSNLLELQISLPTAIVATAAIAIGIHLFDVYCFERKRTTTFRPLPHSPSESRLTLATAESVEDLNRLRSQSYRFEEENGRLNSSEISRRGQLWRRHASWHIEQIPRVEVPQSFGIPDGLNHLKELLGKYQIDYKRGFLPKDDPLHRLPYARYHVWEDLADDLPKLLGARLGQARYPLKQLPVLATDKLITDAELRRAHLILSLFAHAYVWGGTTPMDIIPAGTHIEFPASFLTV